MGWVILNVLLAAVPSVGIILVFYLKSRSRRGSAFLVFKVFVLGFFAVLPALAAELALSSVARRADALWYPFIRAFALSAFVEESVKLTVVRVFVYDREEFGSITNAILYTVAASLGFAFFENILYSFGPAPVLIIRGLTAIPLHAAASGIMGYQLGLSRTGGRGRIFGGLALAVLLHGSYNFLLFLQSNVSLLAVPLAGYGLWTVFRLYRTGAERDRAAGRI